ncbi:MAG: N-acetylornithine carbamoyltransferase [Myxococcota bacterium]
MTPTSSLAERRAPALARFHSLAELAPEEIDALLALAARLERAPEPRALSGKLLGLLFFDPSLRTLASMQAAMHRLGGGSIVLTPGRGTWQLESRDGVVMDGEAAEHVREAIPVLAGYVDALGIRAFAGGTDLAADLADTEFGKLADLSPAPTINLESALDHPCQALGDWKTLDELDVPTSGKLVLSWANHPKPLPLAVPATVVQMAAARGMEVVVLRPEEYALPPSILERARTSAAASGGSVRETSDRDDAMAGAVSLYGKSWSSSFHYGDVAAERELRARLAGWTIDLDWFDNAAPDCRFLHCLPVRRNVVVTDAVLDSPGSAVVRQAHNRLWAQMAVLHTLLGGER